MSQHALMR